MVRFFQNDKRDVLKYHPNYKFKKSAESVRSAGEKNLPQKRHKINVEANAEKQKPKKPYINYGEIFPE